MLKFFASDNCAPAHPSIFEALSAMKGDHLVSYGEDALTKQSVGLIENLFSAPVLGVEGLARKALQDPDRNPYFHRKASVCYVYNGTAANIVCIASLLRPGQSVACGHHAHINEDEGGAIEAASGIKLRHVSSADGKLRVEDLEPLVHELGNVHRSQPSMISLSQTTELATMYQPEEIRRLADWAHEHTMFVHLDGARIANAVAAQLSDTYPNYKSFSTSRLLSAAEQILRLNTVEAGVDAMALGGTKNGLMFGEGVVFFIDPEKVGVGPDGFPSLDLSLSMAGRRAPFVRKHHMQLASKMRYISVQMQTLYGSDLWIKNALTANEMLAYLVEGLEEIASSRTDGLPRALYETPANAAFVQFPKHCIDELQERHHFYVMDVPNSVARLMCSWDTTREDVDALLASVRELIV